jgi:peptidyl-prolyl cis-trans isomerase C
VSDEALHSVYHQLSLRRDAPPWMDLRAEAERRIVERTLLLQMARTQGIWVSEEEIEAERRRRWGSAYNSQCGGGVRAVLEEDLLLERVQAEAVKHVPRPSRTETETYYGAHPEEFFQSERLHAAHIVRNIAHPDEEIDALAAMQSAERELALGKNFARVADRYSDCKGVGGEIGWIARGEMAEDFESVVFGLAKRERSCIFRTVFGLHIAMVLDRKAAGTQPFEDVRQPLARRLFQERQSLHLSAVIRELVHSAMIVAAEEP